MIKTITLDGLTSVTVKESPFDMARFCWLYNHSDSDVFASCVNADCTENADDVLRVPAGEPRMLDTESLETLYLNGSGTVEIITSAFAVCPFPNGAKGGESGGGLTQIYRGALSVSSSEPTVFECDISAYTAIILCAEHATTIDGTNAIEQFCPTVIMPKVKITAEYNEFLLCGYPYNSSFAYKNGYIKYNDGKFTMYADNKSVGSSAGIGSGIIIYGIIPAVGGGGGSITVDSELPDAGSEIQPVYFSDGKPIACKYTLGKSVPSDAVFTDTIYTLPKATISALGGVIPDGTSITVDENGVISAVGSGETNYIIQYGVAKPSSGNLDVTFPKTFATTPTVVVSAATNSNGTATIAYLRGVSESGFTAYERVYSGGSFANSGYDLYWIAIGEV